MFLLRELILDDGEGAAGGLDVHARVLELLERGDVDVLDLDRDHVAILGEGEDILAVLEGTLGGDGGDGGGGLEAGLEAVEANAHGRGGDGEHAAELAAAEDADLRRAGEAVRAHRVGGVGGGLLVAEEAGGDASDTASRECGTAAGAEPATERGGEGRRGGRGGHHRRPRSGFPMTGGRVRRRR